MSGLDYLHGVEVVEIDSGTRPIRTAKAGVIGVIGSAGKGKVNEPVLILGNRTKFTEEFGAYTGDGFTLPEAADGIFDQFGAAVVFINVCNPEVHNTDVTGEVVTLNKSGSFQTAKPFISALTLDVSAITVVKKFLVDSITLPTGATLGSVKSADGTVTHVEATDYTVADNVVTLVAEAGISVGDSVLVTYSQTLAAGDYAINADTGKVDFGKDGKVAAGSTLTVSYTHVDPSKVTEADIIGGVQPDGSLTGVQALKAANSEVYVTPRILIAPHFTNLKADAATANPVVAELLGIAPSLRAVVYADAPSTTDAEAIQYRNDWDSKRIVVLDPFVKVLNPKSEYVFQPRSIRRAGLAAKVINDQGFHVSPSNYPLAGMVGTQRPIDSGMSDKNSTANYLNENEVATCIRMDGFREWGLRTTSSDPKWAFESVVRTADMIQESIVMAHLWAVDRNITTNLVGSIVESVNAYLRHLKAQGVILGGKCWVDPELNTPESVMEGKLFIDFDFTPPYPAEHIVFRSHMVNDYITEVFGGGAEEESEESEA